MLLSAYGNFVNPKLIKSCILNYHKKIPESHLNYLKKNFQIVSLDEIIKNPGKNKIAITFDDGCKENYTEVFPIIKKNKTPVTIFITTKYVGTNRIWKEINPKDVKPIKRNMMSWKEIKKMKKSGLVTFGSHTHSHRVLTKLSENEIKEELEKSKEILEKELGEKILYIAYPKGRFNKKIKNKVKDFYSFALTTKNSFIKEKDYPYEIRRVCISENYSINQIKALLSLKCGIK